MSGGNGFDYHGDDLSGIAASMAERDYEEETRLRKHETLISEIGDIALLGGKATSSRDLEKQGISPEHWIWAKRKAEKSLPDSEDMTNFSMPLIRGLIGLGKLSAIARYAKWERIHYHLAHASSITNGFRAILEQFISQEFSKDINRHATVESFLRRARYTEELTAYQRTGMVQVFIHRVVNDAIGAAGVSDLKKNDMREILSCARLHYSVDELNRLETFHSVERLQDLYKKARREARASYKQGNKEPGRHIKNWELRHLHPLTYLYPYSIRNALDRGISHVIDGMSSVSHSVAVNELALAKCSLMLRSEKEMRRLRDL